MGLCDNKEELKDHTYPLVDPSLLVASEESCRMCWQNQISVHDPVLQLGCNCLGNNRCAHKSCIQKWFRIQYAITGVIACEICRANLGCHVRSIVVAGIPLKMMLRALVHIGERIAIIAFVRLVQLLNDMLEYWDP